MLTEARRRISEESKLSALKTTKLDLVRLDVGQIPMKDESIDCLHAGAAMHCWPDLDAAASEIYRVLKPNGRYFATTFLSPYFSNLSRMDGQTTTVSQQAYQYFESIDTLYANKSPVLRLFQDRIESETSPQEDKILDITYENEINVLNKLRLGAYSSLICYYNYSTGAYEEYTYSLADSYDKMGHQGTQSGLGKGQKDLSKYPTRVMSVLLDHETWYSGGLAASPEQRDGGEGATEFPDYQKYYMAQSISRMSSMNLQKAQIKISGRPSLKVGDSVEIFIPNQVVAKERANKPWDPEHSGIYLVTSVQHKYLCKKARCYTFIGIMRDSYGAPGYASNVEG